MDGRGRALDNIFIERLWRSVKYEDIYPKGYRTMTDALKGLTWYFPFYNTERPHQSLKYSTPWMIHYGGQKEDSSTQARDGSIQFKDLLKDPVFLS